MATPERDTGSVDSRKQFQLSQKSAVEVAGFIGGFYGGISYGVTRFVAELTLLTPWDWELV